MFRHLSTLFLLLAQHELAPQSQDAGGLLRLIGDPVLRIDGEEISSEEDSRGLIDSFRARLATTFAGDQPIEGSAARRGIELPRVPGVRTPIQPRGFSRFCSYLGGG